MLLLNSNQFDIKYETLFIYNSFLYSLFSLMDCSGHRRFRGGRNRVIQAKIYPTFLFLNFVGINFPIIYC